MKKIITILFILCFSSIFLGYFLELPYSEKLIGFGVCGLFFFVASNNLIIITISCEFKTLSEKYKAYKAIYYNVQTIDSIK